MMQQTAKDYSEFIKVDLKAELNPLHETIEDVLTRLEEFEGMATIIQLERDKVMGLTGAMTEFMGMKPQLDTLCSRIDAVELLVENVLKALDQLEAQVTSAEEKLSISDTGNLMNRLMPLLFKKPQEAAVGANPTDPVDINIDDYFTQPQS